MKNYRFGTTSSSIKFIPIFTKAHLEFSRKKTCVQTNIVSSICIFFIHAVQRTPKEIKVKCNAFINELKSDFLGGRHLYKGADWGVSEQDRNQHLDVEDGCSLVKLVLSQKMALPYGNRKAKNVHSTSLVDRVTATSGWALGLGVRIVGRCNILRTWLREWRRGGGVPFIHVAVLWYYIICFWVRTK